MDITTLVIVALVGIAIGFLIGIIINSIRSSREELPTDTLIQVTESPFDRDTFPEVLHLDRETARANLRVRMDGQVFQKIEEMNSAQRKTLEDVLLEMRSWTGTSAFAYSDSPMQSSAFSSYDSPYKSTVYNPYGVEPTPITEVEPVALTIVKQIDNILQDKIAVSPNPWRLIHLVEAPNNEVRIQVDSEQFNDVEDIPEEAVRELIKTSVADWERNALK